MHFSTFQEKNNRKYSRGVLHFPKNLCAWTGHVLDALAATHLDGVARNRHRHVKDASSDKYDQIGLVYPSFLIYSRLNRSVSSREKCKHLNTRNFSLMHYKIPHENCGNAPIFCFAAIHQRLHVNKASLET